MGITKIDKSNGLLLAKDLEIGDVYQHKIVNFEDADIRIVLPSESYNISLRKVEGVLSYSFSENNIIVTPYNTPVIKLRCDITITREQ